MVEELPSNRRSDFLRLVNAIPLRLSVLHFEWVIKWWVCVTITEEGLSIQDRELCENKWPETLHHGWKCHDERLASVFQIV